MIQISNSVTKYPTKATCTGCKGSVLRMAKAIKNVKLGYKSLMKHGNDISLSIATEKTP